MSSCLVSPDEIVAFARRHDMMGKSVGEVMAAMEKNDDNDDEEEQQQQQQSKAVFQNRYQKCACTTGSLILGPITTTDVAGTDDTFWDDAGKQHFHDSSTTSHRITCSHCNQIQFIVKPHRCFCGWEQGKPETGYQGVKHPQPPQNVEAKAKDNASSSSDA